MLYWASPRGFSFFLAELNIDNMLNARVAQVRDGDQPSPNKLKQMWPLLRYGSRNIVSARSCTPPHAPSARDSNCVPVHVVMRRDVLPHKCRGRALERIFVQYHLQEPPLAGVKCPRGTA